jgi:hypothetical protein
MRTFSQNSSVVVASIAACHCVLLLSAVKCCSGFLFHGLTPTIRVSKRAIIADTIAIDTSSAMFHSSDWSNFEYLDDDEEIEVDLREYAKEEDSQKRKAQVGATLEPPTIINDADPIFVPPGSQLELDEETVLGVLSACRQEIGTLFGYSAENRGVGITGGVDFVEMDGPVVVLSLKGRFWHERTTVLERVSAYLKSRIPEIIDVTVEDDWQD